MSKKDTSKMRKELLKRREELLRNLENLEMLRRAPAEGLSVESGDQAMRDLEGESIALVAETHADELQRVEEALERIDSGTYGVCQACGKPISKERLKALPSAILCLECKRQEEMSEDSAGERGYVQRWGEADDMLAEIDEEEGNEAE